MYWQSLPTLQQPEAYIGQAGELFAENGDIKKDDTRKFLQKFIDAYVQWVEKITRV